MSARYDFRQNRPTRLLRALVEAHRWIIELSDEQIRSYGLTTCEFDFLVTLGVAQPLRMSDLARRSLQTKSHTTQVMKSLEGRGLVRRERSPENEREVLASLTAEGEALFEKVYPQQYEWLRNLMEQKLTESEQEELTRLLRRLADEG